MNPIIEQKKSLRADILKKRNSASKEQKNVKDSLIYNFLINSYFFNSCNTALLYYSVNDEVDTLRIIEYCLSINKKIALPVCKRDGLLDFYFIESLTDLTEGKFKIPAPDISFCKPVTDYSDSVCIVPALCFDKTGSRLGYGGGYYDRFLKSHNVFSIGLCYDSFLYDTIPSENHDIKVDSIVTESGFYCLKKE